MLDDVLTVVVIDLHIVEGLKEVQVLNHGGGDVAPHALHKPCRVFELAAAVDERCIGDGKPADKRGEVGEHGLALLDAEKLIVLVPVHEGLGVERDVGEVGPGELGLVARDRFGDVVCPVVEDEREQIVASLAAAVSALVDKDAELLGQWGLLMERIKKAGGLPRHLEVAQ